jgi:tetratricopeptide (TPR) repeat protein
MPTFQELLRARQRETFVGREDESLEFRENLIAPIDDPGRRAIFSVQGQGGMGKSTFVRHCCEIATAVGAQASTSDESDEDLLEVMESLSRGLERDAFGSFRQQAEKYRRLRRDVEARSDAPDDTTRIIAANLGEIGTKLARRIPVAGAAFDFVDEEKLGAQLGEVAAFVVKNYKKREDVDLLLDPIGTLTPVFVEAVSDLLTKGPLVLCFDTFEETSSYLEPWMFALLEGHFGTFPGNLSIIIAGRDGLNPNVWGEFDALVSKIEMLPLSEEESASYLASKKITSASQVRALLDRARGVPLFLAILAMGGQDGLTANEGMVDRILRLAPSAFRESAITGAIPRVLNRDVGRLLFGDDQADAVLEWLIGMPFVRPAADGWRYHDLIRPEFLHYGRRKSPSGWRAVHKQLADHHATQEQMMTEAGDYATARREAVESAYHLMFVRQREGFTKASAAALLGWSLAPPAARVWAQAMRGAGRDMDRPALTAWGDGWLVAIRSAAHHDDAPAIALFSKIIGDADLADSHSSALMCRSLLYRQQGRYDVALRDAERAEQLDPDPVYFGYQRAQTYLDGGDPETALEQCEAALMNADNDDESRFWVLLLLRVAILRVLFSAETALGVVNELEDVDVAAKYVARGELLREVKDYDAAIADLKVAMELEPSRRHTAWKEIGTARLEQEDHEQAVASIEESLRAAPACGHCWEMLAHIYARSSAEDEIKDKLIATMEIDDPTVRPYRALGIMAHGSIDHACQELEAAVIEDPSNPDIRLWLVEALESAGRWGDVGRELSECLRLRPQWPSALKHRARLRYREGDFLGAEEDWEWIGTSMTGELPVTDMASRGHGLSIVGRYGEALEVFDKVMAVLSVPEVAYNRVVAESKNEGREPTDEERDACLAILAESEHEVVKRYGEAGLLALRNETDVAFDTLAAAFELDGASVANWASTDPAWMGLRDSEQFRTIMIGGGQPSGS